MDARDHYRRQGFGRPIGFGDRPALLIVDMQRDFVDPDAPTTCAPIAQERLPAIEMLLAASRREGIPVIFSRGLVSPDLSDVGLWKSAAHARGRVQVEGSAGAEIVPELAPGPGEWVVTKRRPSAFFQTDLHGILQSLRVDTLLIGGTSMSGCVRATVVDAFSHDYRTMVVRECVIDRSSTVLEANLFDVDSKYADVVALQDVLRYLEDVPRRSEGADSSRP
jgi:maleamate amidohydrolase